MKQFIDDISDDEFRTIGHIGNSPSDREDYTPQQPLKPKSRRPKAALVAALLLAVGVIVLVVMVRPNAEQPATEQSMSVEIEVNAAEPATEIRVTDTVVAGKPLQIVCVDKLMPSLHVGVVDTTDKSIRVVLQAADYRADNGEIVGDYVLAGEQLSRGSSKQGYCEINGNQLSIGNSDESGCAQCAIEQKGYFFRQYLLVSNGDAQSLKPKGKHRRRALCMTAEGNLMIVLSQEELTFEEFAQILEKIPVSQAIYLTGGSAYGYRRTLEGEIIHFGYPKQTSDQPNVNYIVFR